mmetsp:Transcript_12460/g.37435  ORF Transcript_12460/g.37435 Transcript_12460/m.37435 type:complete len:254 (+) Transcript_12460:1459-2220(+)
MAVVVLGVLRRAARGDLPRRGVQLRGQAVHLLDALDVQAQVLVLNFSAAGSLLALRPQLKVRHAGTHERHHERRAVVRALLRERAELLDGRDGPALRLEDNRARLDEVLHRPVPDVRRLVRGVAAREHHGLLPGQDVAHEENLPALVVLQLEPQRPRPEGHVKLQGVAVARRAAEPVPAPVHEVKEVRAALEVRRRADQHRDAAVVLVVRRERVARVVAAVASGEAVAQRVAGLDLPGQHLAALAALHVEVVA